MQGYLDVRDVVSERNYGRTGYGQRKGPGFKQHSGQSLFSVESVSGSGLRGEVIKVLAQ